MVSFFEKLGGEFRRHFKSGKERAERRARGEQMSERQIDLNILRSRISDLSIPDEEVVRYFMEHMRKYRKESLLMRNETENLLEEIMTKRPGTRAIFAKILDIPSKE